MKFMMVTLCLCLAWFAIFTGYFLIVDLYIVYKLCGFVDFVGSACKIKIRAAS